MDRREFRFFLGTQVLAFVLFCLWILLFATGCGENFDGGPYMISDLSGQLNLSDPRMIQPGDYAIGRTEERLDGILQSRRGISKANPSSVLPAGITAYFNNGSHGYVQAGTKIYRTDTWAEIHTLSSSAKLRAIRWKSYTQTDNELFLGNGVDMIRIGSDRAVYKWGIGTPSVSSSSGSLFASDVAQNPSSSFFNGSMVMVGTDIFLCDTYRHTIVKITSAGVVSVFAGTQGSSGSADGTGAAARFYYPRGITAVGTDLYVVDNANSTIRKITSGAVVTTLAGLALNPGSADGTGSAARFNNPVGIATDATDLFICDQSNFTIRKCTTAGVVTTLAGSAGVAGSADGTGSAARFYFPDGITYLGTNLYITDRQNHLIRKCTLAAVVTTLAGDNSGIYPGYVNGTGAAARFSLPTWISNDGTYLVVLDQYATVYRKVTTAGVVTDWGISVSSGFPGSTLYNSGNWYVHDRVGSGYVLTKLYKYKLLTLTSSGTGLTGDYWVAFAYARKVGSSVAHVGNPTTPVQITGLANQGISVAGMGNPSSPTDPDYDLQVTHIFIYRSRSGGGQYQLYKDVEVNVGTTSAILTQGDIYLGADVEWDNDLPSASAVLGRPDNQGYMFAAVGNQIHYSKAQRPEAWPGSQSFNVGSPQWPVKSILYAKASTWIKTEDANHLLQGSGKSFVAVPFPMNDGATGSDSCLSEEGTMWHVGKEGIYESTGSAQDLKITDGILDALWNGTAEDDDSILLSSISQAVLARKGDRVYLLYPGSADAGALTRLLAIDTAKKKLLSVWKFPAAVVPTCLAYDDSGGFLYLGAGNGYLYKLDSGLTDDGTSIAYKIRSKDLYTGRYIPLSYGKADLSFPPGMMGPTGTLYADGVSVVSAVGIVSHSPIRIVPTNGESALRWSLEISGSADGTGAHKFYALELVG
jgi:hypothetical protein